MSMAQRNGRYTVADYQTWPDEERWELIDGEAYMMTPAPSGRHQQISSEVGGQLWTALKASPCVLYYAPTDLAFEAAEDTDTVVQPDLFIMCGPHKSNGQVIGIPVLVIEILSLSTARRDKVTKRALYERVGVKEYWIVDPVYEVIDVFVHDGTEYSRNQTVAKGDSLSVSMLDGVWVDVEAVFTKNRASETEE